MKNKVIFCQGFVLLLWLEKLHRINYALCYNKSYFTGIHT